MMAGDYDHRWEPLAEIHFSVNDEFTDEHYIYCLCSRVFIRDGIKLYYVEKEIGSESDVDAVNESKIQVWNNHSHVHFSEDTSYKAKCEKDEGASCYCSASHTDNYCSTDEHDPIQIQSTVYHVLQPSDSGADLTYQDNHSDFNVPTITNNELSMENDKMEEEFTETINSELKENYQSENTWEKFWAVNGERLIWESWIKNYSSYINPAYLDKNNELCIDENNIPKEQSTELVGQRGKSSMRERKFSYDSKVNPYKRRPQNEPLLQKSTVKQSNESSSKDDWLFIGRTRSCSEHDRMLSPRTLATTDSMTNVTKMTLSSYDITSSHVTSESTASDDYSVSSSTSDDPSNDQTRLCNIDDSLDQTPVEDMDSEQYWQFLWKKHFGEQYAFHLANYVDCNTVKNYDDNINEIRTSCSEVPKNCIKPSDADCENSEGNSQEMPSVIEVQSKIDEIKLEEKSSKKKKRASYNKYISSVGVLLQKILKEDIRSDVNEPSEVGEDTTATKDYPAADTVDGSDIQHGVPKVTQSNFNSLHMCGGGDEPPEEKPINLKRSHEDDADIEEEREKIKVTFETMGLCVKYDEMPWGEVVYQKRLSRLRPPRSKKNETLRKTYFDEDGNPINIEKESHDEREMQTDDDCPDVKSDDELETEHFETVQSNVKIPELDESCSMPQTIEYTNLIEEALAAPLPPNADASFSDVADEVDDDCSIIVEKSEFVSESTGSSSADVNRRRRPKRRRSPVPRGVALPPEFLDDPRIMKYWRKRHSLFHRFDEGIKLDTESWFSVTPEKVARHLAERCRCDLIVDAFCGAGGNAIQFAWTCERVIAIDIDPVKIELARHNASVYGVADRIEFIVGDFFELAPRLTADVVFLSPPWGGPQYSKSLQYDLETMLVPKPSSELMAVAQAVSQNVALYVPRNSRSEQLIGLAKSSGAVEIEQNYLGRRFIAITAYYGELLNY